MKVDSLDRKIKRTYYLEPYQVEALKLLSQKARIRQVDFIREAVDNLILKYQEKLPKDLIVKAKKKFK